MSYLYHIYILTILTIGKIEGSGPNCDPTQFSAPFARVVKTRNGQDLDAIDKSGFMDTTKYTQKILCINGPAVVYSKVDVSPNRGAIFSETRLQVFQHECIIFNQIKTKKAIQLRDEGVVNPTLFDVPDDFIVSGTRVTGVYLISEPGDYLLPTSVMFRQHDLAYMFNSSNEQVEEGSFVGVGAGPFCLSVNGEFDIVLVGQEGYVCKWTKSNDLHPQFLQRYNKIFDGSRHISKMNQWSDCGGGVGGGIGLGPYPPPGPSDTTTTDSSFDPFAIIMTSHHTVRGGVAGRNYKSKNSGYRNKGRAFQKGELTNVNHDGMGGILVKPEGEDDAAENLEIIMDSSLCHALPERLDPSNLPAECGKADDSAAVTALGLLHNLFAVDAPSDGTTEPQHIRFKGLLTATPPGPDVTWKNVILDLTSEIFSKICEPFEEEVPYTVSRLLEFYLAKAHHEKPELRTDPGVWEHLIGDLDRCRNSTKTGHLLWYWDNQNELNDDIDPGPPDCMDCKVQTCTDNCVYDEAKGTCVFPKDGCKDAQPICPGQNCKFDDPSKQCVKELEDDVDCNEEPSCPAECRFDVGFGVCAEPECKVESCEPESCCKVSMDKEKCELRGFVPGAFPSATGSEGSPHSPRNKGPAPDEEDDPAGAGSTAGMLINRPNPPYTKHWIQETFKPRPEGGYNFGGFPENVLVITSIKNGSARGRAKEFEDNGVKIIGQCLFYYHDLAETHYELNIAIDIYWKMFTTVIGYCNSHYETRKAEVFPRLYNTFYEDFLEPIADEWKFPKHNEILRILLSKENSERMQKWLDVCLESSYVYSNSPTFRPPRPLLVGDKGNMQPNYFNEIPDYIQAKFKPVNLADHSELVRCQ